MQGLGRQTGFPPFPVWRPFASRRTLPAMNLMHPDMIDGRSLWVDPEVQELLNLLHYGDPTLGWGGDERLALYRGAGGRWVLNRLGEDGKMYTVCVSKPGLSLDRGLITHLVAHDTRRVSAAKQHENLSALKVAAEAAQEAAQQESIQAKLEKVYWGAAKDIGHLY